MNRYWDLSEKQRSALTREQAEAFLAVELMEKGVLAVEPLVLQTEPVVNPEPTAYFGISHKGQYGHDDYVDVCFETLEQAAAFLALKPLIIDSRHEYGYGNQFVRPAVELKIAQRTLPSEAAMVNKASLLTQLRQVQESNERARTHYEQAVKKVADATAGVWADWREQVAHAAKMAEVSATGAKYLSLCAGDELMALANLSKAFDKETLQQWQEWIGQLVRPDIPVSEPEPMEVF